jgi:rifampicin phosphotransferase
MTMLGLRNPVEIADAIQRCWASMWEESAVQYGAFSNGIPADLAMAVVVQLVVPAEVSGVAFSMNPITGDASEVFINSSWGLGEAVVSGLVTPDTHMVDKATLTVTSRQISAAKSTMFVIGDEGTAHRVDVLAELAGADTLSDELAGEIASAAVVAEERAGTPMDIEWAIEGGTLFVLQARPITTI